MNLQEHIDELTRRRAEIDRDLAQDEVELSRLITLGKNLSVIVEGKRERKQHLEYAINNLQTLIELETPVEDPLADVDPWGDAA